MRTRKATKKDKARASLTETDILDACYDYLRARGYKPGDRSAIKIPIYKEGQKRRGKVEVVIELDAFPNPEDRSYEVFT